MKAFIQSHPPLGRVTAVQSGQMSLSSVLQIPTELSTEPWEMSLWISVDDGDWKEIGLDRCPDGLTPQSLQNPTLATSLYFSGHLSLRQRAHFTFKFRQTSNDPWIWTRDAGGFDDGVILVYSPSNSPGKAKNPGPTIPNINPEWNVTSRLSQSPETQLWSLQCPMPGTTGQSSTIRDISLGTPWGSFVRWFALVRHRPEWLGPRHGKSQFVLDQDALLCTFLSTEGRNMAILAVSGVSNVSATLRHDAENCVTIHARSDSLSPAPIIVLVSEGVDFGHAVAAVMYEARNLVSPYAVSNAPRHSGAEKSHSAASNNWKADWMDTLGFCTWNSLGPDLSEKKLLDALKALAEHEIHIGNLIIDDNWQSLDRFGSSQSRHGWAKFEADKNAFPDGLQGLVRQIRSLHPGIQQILVWHALMGYWGGISPDGAIAKTYQTARVKCQSDDNTELTVVAKGDVARLYEDFYKFLADSGITGVKTDVQIMVDSLTDAPDRRDLMSTYLDEWMKASQKHFGAQTISCMSQFPHALFFSQLPWNRREFVVRNSDDYYPDRQNSHTWHVWVNAHNAIFTQFLNVIPDWDMFQTVHEYAEFHAAARCVSGGPVWITDVPGEHDISVLKQVVAGTPNGQTIVLRPSTLGKTTDPYSGFEDGSLLKVGSYVGTSQPGVGILGIFNVSAQGLNELLPLDHFPGIEQSVEYVVRSHKTGRTTTPIALGRGAPPLINVSLDVKKCDVLCAFPTFKFDGKKYDNGHAAILGLLGKMTGCAAITSSQTNQPRSGRVSVTCSVKALGVLGLYISTLPQMQIADDFMVLVEDLPVPVETVQRSDVNNHVIEIDVEKAWKIPQFSTLRRDVLQVKVLFTV